MAKGMPDSICPDGLDGGSVFWERHIALVTNRFMLWDLLRFGLALFILFELFVIPIGFVANGELVLLPPEFLAVIFGIFGAVVAFVMLVVFKNDYHIRFTLDSKRALSEGHLEAGIVYRALIGMQYVMSTGPIGILVMLLGRGRGGNEDGEDLDGGAPSGASEMKWKDVRKVTVHRGARVVTLSSGWWFSLRLHCDEATFDEVVQRVEGYVARAEDKRAARPTVSRPMSARSRYLLVWFALSGLATKSAQLWEGDYTGYASIWVGGLVLLAGLPDDGWRRLLGLLATLACTSFLWLIAGLAFHEDDLGYGLFVIHGYQRDTELFVLTLAGALVLLGMSGYRLLGRSPAAGSRGRRAGSASRHRKPGGSPVQKREREETA
jgi:hypothetical protein